jgi:hypothetical protein
VTAWLDYLDARRRMIHEWREQGIEPGDIAIRLEVDVDRVDEILEQLVEPPLPGCSRDVAARLRRRVAELERELHREVPAADRPPGMRHTVPWLPVPREPRADASEFGALELHPDPERCGCQYWHDTIIAGEHNPRCAHAKEAG